MYKRQKDYIHQYTSVGATVYETVLNLTPKEIEELEALIAENLEQPLLPLQLCLRQLLYTYFCTFREDRRRRDTLCHYAAYFS